MKSDTVAVVAIALAALFVFYKQSETAQVAAENTQGALNQSYPSFNFLYPVVPDNYVGTSVYSGLAPSSPLFMAPTMPNPTYYNYGTAGQGGGFLNELLGQL